MHISLWLFEIFCDMLLLFNLQYIFDHKKKKYIYIYIHLYFKMYFFATLVCNSPNVFHIEESLQKCDPQRLMCVHHEAPSGDGTQVLNL